MYGIIKPTSTDANMGGLGDKPPNIFKLFFQIIQYYNSKTQPSPPTISNAIASMPMCRKYNDNRGINLIQRLEHLLFRYSILRKNHLYDRLTL